VAVGAGEPLGGGVRQGVAVGVAQAEGAPLGDAESRAVLLGGALAEDVGEAAGEGLPEGAQGEAGVAGGQRPQSG
jgi:hypothetical protein